MAGLLLAFVVGACIGSFLNVLVFRTRTHEAPNGRSRCQRCQRVLTPLELVPIASFLALRGRCRGCRKPISAQYPLVETAVGCLFAFVYRSHGMPLDFSLPLIRDLAFVSILALLFTYDLKYKLLPDRFTLPAIAVAFGLNVWLGRRPTELSMGAALAGGFFLLQYVLSRGRWIGGGDIRLGVLMGSMLGLPATLGALVIAYVIGALVGLGLLVAKKADGKTEIPFGTFLTASTFLMLFWGERIIGWYLGFVT
ncbi:hypothetical protein A2856_02380 [Candidatus Uhrbacteria bacterium RIFCSPHIGHO2_01_FULL_63_20]|uniref:Prepilin peptidase n=1 Tax=Candidatus Uhrbacteria bacterium RIFCSPHIGHO2_01_FULL_63_20 TaxID=1802385 RepID=A0A1F7TKM8_9BACT|nr:MAG: hypothetical protein A2856_02380 [Candidatus Uhrbacteria bacterium RIFCSPHIGHO2_01_FULL_63_20]